MADELGVATIENAFGVLRQVLAAAVEDNRIARNACDGVKLPKREHADRGYLTHAQVAALAAAVEYLPEVVRFLAYTGLRWGEMAALRMQDFDMLRRRVNVSRSVTEFNGLCGRRRRTTSRRGQPYDIESSPRKIEVKAFGGSARGAPVPIEERQAQAARGDPDNYYVYVVDNVASETKPIEVRMLHGAVLHDTRCSTTPNPAPPTGQPSAHATTTVSTRASSDRSTVPISQLCRGRIQAVALVRAAVPPRSQPAK